MLVSYGKQIGGTMEGREIVGRLCDAQLRDDSDLDQMGAMVMERSRWIQDRFLEVMGNCITVWQVFTFPLCWKKVVPHSTDGGLGWVTCFGEWNMGRTDTMV